MLWIAAGAGSGARFTGCRTALAQGVAKEADFMVAFLLDGEGDQERGGAGFQCDEIHRRNGR